MAEQFANSFDTNYGAASAFGGYQAWAFASADPVRIRTDASSNSPSRQSNKALVKMPSYDAGKTWRETIKSDTSKCIAMGAFLFALVQAADRSDRELFITNGNTAGVYFAGPVKFHRVVDSASNTDLDDRRLAAPIVRDSSFLNDFGQFTANWDGMGAHGVDPKTVTDAREFLQTSPLSLRDPIAAPSPRGEIDLLYDYDDTYIMATFRGDGRINFYSDTPHGEVSVAIAISDAWKHPRIFEAFSTVQQIPTGSSTASA